MLVRRVGVGPGVPPAEGRAPLGLHVVSRYHSCLVPRPRKSSEPLFAQWRSGSGRRITESNDLYASQTESSESSKIDFDWKSIWLWLVYRRTVLLDFSRSGKERCISAGYVEKKPWLGGLESFTCTRRKEKGWDGPIRNVYKKKHTPQICKVYLYSLKSKFRRQK